MEISLFSLLTFHLRELSRYPRYLWRCLFQPSVISIAGLRVGVGPETTAATRKLLYSERYERGERRCVSLALEQGDVVLEVGAGIGFLSALCARQIGSARVHAYEANPELMGVIRRTHRLNEVEPTVVCAALGEQDGRARFYVSPEFFSSSSEPEGVDHVRSIEVEVRDVNEVMSRLRPTFLIIDIEGGERELVPLIEWASVRKLAIELHPKQLGEDGVRDIVGQLARAGFRQHRLLSSRRKRFFSRRVP